MENWILIVGYGRPHFDAAQKEWVKYNIFLHLAVNALDAIEKFSARRYIAVIASYDLPDMMSLIKVVRETEQIPFAVLSQEDSSTKVAESIIRRADTFIIDPDKLIESLTKNKDIVERLSRLPTQNKQALGILAHREIFMLIDYRKVFVRGEEVPLSKSEFEILQLLVKLI